MLEIKTWHILLVIVLFTIFTMIIGDFAVQNTLSEEADNYLVELDGKTFSDDIADRSCFVLFYVEDSDINDIMRSRLNCIAKDRQKEAGFFKLNLDKYPEYDLKYNISGTPNILVFNDNKEIKRIMGLVSENNLELIYNKLQKYTENGD